MKKELIYRERQTSWGLIVLMVVIIGFISVSYYTQLGEHPVTFTFFSLMFGFFLIVTLIFSTLRIRITEDEIQASFGLNIFRQTMKIKNIDWEQIEITKTSLLQGIGLRFTSKGTLFNTNFGKAIHIKSKQGKTFYVGTKNAEDIKDILLKKLKKLI